MEPIINKQGEVRGCGPIWGCARFGYSDHDYNNCPECKRIFESRMVQLKEDNHAV